MGSFFSSSVSKNLQQKTYRNLNSVINQSLNQRYGSNCLLPQYENLRGSIDAFDSPVTFDDSTTCNNQLQELNQKEQQEMAKRAYPTNPNQSIPSINQPVSSLPTPSYNINKPAYPSSYRRESDAAQIHPWLKKTQNGGKRKTRKSKKSKKTKKSRKQKM
jgi:hypothetical protein